MLQAFIVSSIFLYLQDKIQMERRATPICFSAENASICSIVYRNTSNTKQQRTVAFNSKETGLL